MSDVRGITEDVRFDFDAAAHLAGRFRAAANELDEQVGRRGSLAGAARREWRGRYAEVFDDRCAQGGGDARVLAERMREAARVVEGMADDARAEQSRRERARQWYEDRRASNPIEWVWDRFEDWLLGPDVPPDLRPSDGPSVTVQPGAAVRSSRD